VSLNKRHRRRNWTTPMPQVHSALFFRFRVVLVAAHDSSAIDLQRAHAHGMTTFSL